MKSLSPLAFALLSVTLVLSSLCVAVAEPPRNLASDGILSDALLPPPLPDLPMHVSHDSDPTIIYSEAKVVEPAASPRFEPGIYQRGDRYYRRRNGVEQVYSTECNGRSCKPGWYPVQSVAQAPPQKSTASGCSGVSGCSGSSSRRVRGRLFRGSCGG